MARTKRIFLSDVHMGAGLATDWFTPAHREVLKSFLEWTASRDDVSELILLGDIFDTWVCPMEETPPTIDAIWEHQKDLIPAFQKCVANLDKVFYINGNHDMHVTQNDLARLDSGGKSVLHVNNYVSGRMYGTHGHRFAMFNAWDKLHDPFHHLPLGYYISRIVSEDSNYTSPGAIISYIEDLLEAAFTTETLAHSVIEALMERQNKKPDDPFIMPWQGKTPTIAQVQEKYENLFSLWVAKFGHRYSINAILAEMDHLGWFADRLCKKEDYKVVIMGHTHDPEFDKDALCVDDRIYVNSGYWCSDTPHYVEIEKINSDIKVDLVEYKNGAPEIRDSDEV